MGRWDIEDYDYYNEPDYDRYDAARESAEDQIAEWLAEDEEYTRLEAICERMRERDGTFWRKFLVLLDKHREQVRDEIISECADANAEATDPMGYYGLSESMFH